MQLIYRLVQNFLKMGALGFYSIFSKISLKFNENLIESLKFSKFIEFSCFRLWIVSEWYMRIRKNLVNFSFIIQKYFFIDFGAFSVENKDMHSGNADLVYFSTPLSRTSQYLCYPMILNIYTFLLRTTNSVWKIFQHFLVNVPSVMASNSLFA